jgi:hypothetical protein
MPINSIMALLELYPNKDWEYKELCQREDIPLDYIKNNTKFQLSKLALRKDVDWNFIVNHPEIKWESEDIACNPNLTIDIIRDNLNLDVMESNVIRTKNPKYYDFLSVFMMSGTELARNPNTTIEIIRANPDIDWDYEEYSSNPNVNIQTVKNNPNYCWRPKLLQDNPNISLKDMYDNQKFFDYDFNRYSYEEMDKKLRLEGIAMYDDGIHSRFSEESEKELDSIIQNTFKVNNIRKFYVKEDVYIHIDGTYYMTLKMVNTYKKIDWVWSSIIENIGVIPEEVFKDETLHDMRYPLSYNFNLTWKDVRNQPDSGWNWKSISINPMNRTPAAIIIQRAWKKYRKIIRTTAAITIQRWWRELCWRPNGLLIHIPQTHFESLQN